MKIVYDGDFETGTITHEGKKLHFKRGETTEVSNDVAKAVSDNPDFQIKIEAVKQADIKETKKYKRRKGYGTK